MKALEENKISFFLLFFFSINDCIGHSTIFEILFAVATFFGKWVGCGAKEDVFVISHQSNTGPNITQCSMVGRVGRLELG
jgi:hypothetical protein